MKLLTPRNELGPTLHTALRKFGDGKATSLTWNIIDLIAEFDAPERYKLAWTEFLNLAWNELRKPGLTKENAPKRLKSAADQIRLGCSARNALRLSFYYFNEDDWTCFTQLLQFEVESI